MQEIINILSSLGFNWHVALANFINFLIVLFILNKFFFGKIGKVIHNRKVIIEQGLQDSENAKRILSGANDEKHTILLDAQKESKEIIQKAELTARSVADGIRAEAQTAADARMVALSHKEATLKESIEKAFGDRAPELVAKLYAKTLLKNMNESENNALIAQMK